MDEAERAELAEAVRDQDRADVLFLRLAQPLLPELRVLAEKHPEGERARFAAACCLTAVLERVARIARRDLPEPRA